jgi:putative PEP-CTERM system histidine kinase
MENAVSALATGSYGIAAAAYGLFASHLLHRGYLREGLRAQAMLGATLASALWAALGLLFGLSGVAGVLQLVAVADILRYGGWYLFLLVLMTPPATTRIAAAGRWIAWSAALLVAAGIALHLMRLSDAALPDTSQWVAVHALAMVVFAIFLLEQLLRNVKADSRWNVKPLLLGLGAAFLFDLYLFSDALLFKRVDPDIFSVRGFVQAAVIPLLAMSTVRGGARLAKIRLSQTVAFHSTTLMLVGAYLLFMALVGYYVRYFGGEWGRAVQYGLLFAALLLLSAILLSAAMRARIRVLVGKHFFRYRYDYREEWLRFTRVLSEQGSLRGMGEQVIRGLANMVESPAGSLWVRDATTRRFTQLARWNMPQSVVEEDEEGSLCAFLRRSGWVIDLEEFRRFSSRYREFEIPEWLSHTSDAWLVVPLFAGADLIGFVILARARTDIEIDWEVNDLLKTAGRQAASFLAQVLAAEQLLEARKFDAFNRMSAFVVHDLKNIVTQLALLVKNAERHGDNPEFRQDMLMTVQNAVERMRQLMLQLREGAAPAGGQHGVPLGDIARRIGATHQAQGREIEITVAEPVMARGHDDRIERVIGHAVQNSLDATAATDRVWIAVDREGGRARVVVGDEGHGMSPEFVRERLFKPFQTTKETGMGIGAYESFQYIRELGGDVRVASEVGKGTTITLLFPLFESGSSVAAGVTDGR